MMLSADGTALVHARRLDHDFCPAVPKTPRKKPHHSSVFIVKRNRNTCSLIRTCPKRLVPNFVVDLCRNTLSKFRGEWPISTKFSDKVSKIRGPGTDSN